MDYMPGIFTRLNLPSQIEMIRQWLNRQIMFRLPIITLVLAVLLAACSAGTGLLPHFVYFLDDQTGVPQVWRLERDGSTLSQVTAEESGVDSFAVSARNGMLAFVSANRLHLVDADGRNRRQIADGNLVEVTGEDAVFRTIVSNPVFSPDGRTLAYALDGLHFLDIATGRDQHMLTNLGNLEGEPYVFSREVYSPGPWSPDGSRLLLIMGYYEGSTLAVMEPGAADPYQRLWSDGPLCCQFSWSADGKSVLVANPYFTTDLPGLWRYDAVTGEPSILVHGQGEGGMIHFAGWPVEPRSGELLFFHAAIGNFSPEAGIPLVLNRSEADGSNLTPVRPEEFRVWQALWASDGSLVLVVGRLNGGEPQLYLVRPDNRPLQVLMDDARGIQSLTWGP